MTLHFVAALKVEIARLGVEPQINPFPVVSIQKNNTLSHKVIPKDIRLRNTANSQQQAVRMALF
jgi:hypothetical protein